MKLSSFVVLLLVPCVFGALRVKHFQPHNRIHVNHEHDLQMLAQTDEAVVKSVSVIPSATEDVAGLSVQPPVEVKSSSVASDPVPAAAVVVAAAVLDVPATTAVTAPTIAQPAARAAAVVAPPVVVVGAPAVVAPADQAAPQTLLSCSTVDGRLLCSPASLPDAHLLQPLPPVAPVVANAVIPAAPALDVVPPAAAQPQQMTFSPNINGNFVTPTVAIPNIVPTVNTNAMSATNSVEVVSLVNELTERLRAAETKAETEEMQKTASIDMAKQMVEEVKTETKTIVTEARKDSAAEHEENERLRTQIVKLEEELQALKAAPVQLPAIPSPVQPAIIQPAAAIPTTTTPVSAADAVKSAITEYEELKKQYEAML
jgi:hypothetical protein